MTRRQVTKKELAATRKRKFLAPEPVVSLSEGFGCKSKPGNDGVGRLRQCVYNVGRVQSVRSATRQKIAYNESLGPAIDARLRPLNESYRGCA